MLIQCLIDRDGPTFVAYAGKRFDFVKNRNGHYVADINNPAAVNYFLDALAGNMYQEYAEAEPPEEVVESVKREEPKSVLKVRYNAMKSKSEVETACKEDFGVDLDRRKGLGKMKAEVFALIDKE